MEKRKVSARFFHSSTKKAIVSASGANAKQSEKKTELPPSIALHMVSHYLIHHGYKNTAAALLKASNQSDNLYMMDERLDIADKFSQRDMDSVFALIGEKFPGLMESHKMVSFHIHSQRFLILLDQGKKSEAILYGRKYLAPLATESPEIMNHVKGLLSLLVYTDPSACPDVHYTSPAFLHEGIECLKSAMMEFQRQPAALSLVTSMKQLAVAHDTLNGEPVEPQVGVGDENGRELTMQLNALGHVKYQKNYS